MPLALYAAELGDFGIVKYIVEYSRASMNTMEEDHRTILHYAAKSGNLEMNRYLVEKVGMDITAGDRWCGDCGRHIKDKREKCRPTIVIYGHDRYFRQRESRIYTSDHAR